MKRIDGAYGEGGGQILRTSLSLAAVTRTPVEVSNIRAGRTKPGLLKQHLCAVQAVNAVCGGRLQGAELGSPRVVFEPGAIRPGDYHFAVGSAGSASLVLQTLIPPLLTASRSSRVVIEGGSHNPAAPPFEFLDRVFASVLEPMGAKVDLQLERAGFYPTGGGRIVAAIEPAPAGLGAFERLDRGALTDQRGEILTSGLAAHVARRERAELQTRLGDDFPVRVCPCAAVGPGNAVIVDLSFEHGRAVFVGFGARGKPAETVAAEAAAQATAFVEANVAVDVHLADQLIIPLAMGAGGAFRTGRLSGHTQTNIAVVSQFLPSEIRARPDGPDRVVVEAYPRT